VFFSRSYSTSGWLSERVSLLTNKAGFSMLDTIQTAQKVFAGKRITTVNKIPSEITSRKILMMYYN